MANKTYKICGYLSKRNQKQLYSENMDITIMT